MDTTNHKRAEVALGTSEARYHTIFAGAAVSLWEEGFSHVFTLLEELKIQGVTDFSDYFNSYPEAVVNAARRVRGLDVNPESLTLFSARSKEDLLATIDRTLVPDSFSVFQQQLVAFAAGRRSLTTEARLRALTGEPRTVLLTVSLFANGDRPASHGLVTITNLTVVKHTEAERERTLAELRHANAELQQFAHIVSHDLKEPLRTISNYTQLLAQRTKGNLDKPAEEYMAFITDAAQHMQRMRIDLLAYTRAGQTLDFRPVNCDAVLAQVLRALQTRITETQAEITADPLPTVLGDETRLGQVLQNLIGNAMKFCGHAPPRIQVSAQRDGTYWRFAAWDNGVGIDPGQAGKLFQVFQRAHGKEYPGTGIGLAICKKIVEQHGGKIWVESKPGEGSTLYFTVRDTGEGEFSIVNQHEENNPASTNKRAASSVCPAVYS
jgi:signal transduction histidine kinase